MFSIVRLLVFTSELTLHTAQKMKFSIKDFFSKCDQIRRKTADLIIFIEEISNAKLHFLCSCNSQCNRFRPP